MRCKKTIMVFLVFILILGTMSAIYASPAMDGEMEDEAEHVPKKDNREDPLTAEQLELKARAIEARLNGKGLGKGKVVEVAKGQFVELEREGEKPVWTVLGEFSDLPHNGIYEPDRSVDNSTIWVPDFSRNYYMDMLFAEGEGVNSMRNYYIEQSSNRFAVYGDVTDWVTVPGNHDDYDDEPGPSVWQFLQESVDGWYDVQIAAGKTDSEINVYLSQFDVWDRYDWDNDGNFDEPDGYIDTFQSVHAGLGEEASDNIQDIWSHSGYAYSNGIGNKGPSPDFLLGGIQIGESNFWVNKYTIQPENGGVGVFAHEFAHSMGLPDLYDYAGENGTGFWTLMSSGSWLSDGVVDIGSKPSHMGVWEKFQLGWLNYEVAFAGEKSVHRLGPAEFNTKQAQGVFVVLPPKEVTEAITDPYSGDYFYYSGAGNNLDNLMYKDFNLTSGTVLAAKVKCEIETDWDYAYLMISTDGGYTWANLETNLSTTYDPNGQNFGYGITGHTSGWVDLTADLSAYVGDVLLGFRYWTDVAVVENGFMIDDIDITGYPTDGAESDAGWTFAGFGLSTGTESGYYSHYYVCEYRTYLGYDSTLSTGPYNFGFHLLPNYVERFPYQDGLLISYWDTSHTDNTSDPEHLGEGLLLPIDAHYDALYRDDNLWRNRIQTYDSTFGIAPTDAMTLHYDGYPYEITSLPGVRTFDDRIQHYDELNPNGSVKHEDTGTMITVLQESRINKAPFMQIRISPSK